MVICVTDGRRSHQNSRLWPQQRLVAQRRQELENAMAVLGNIVVHHLDYPDCEGPVAGDAVARISGLVPQGAKFLSTWPGIRMSITSPAPTSRALWFGSDRIWTILPILSGDVCDRPFSFRNKVGNWRGVAAQLCLRTIHIVIHAVRRVA